MVSLHMVAAAMVVFLAAGLLPRLAQAQVVANGTNQTASGTITTTGTPALHALNGGTITGNPPLSVTTTGGATAALAESGGSIVSGSPGSSSTSITSEGIGLAASGVNSNATLQNFAITTTGPGTSGSNNYGAQAIGGGVLNLENGTITTTFPESHGLLAEGAPSQITATNVTIATTGFTAHDAASTDGGRITINGGSLTTAADGTTAILVIRGGSQVVANGTTITTTGFGSSGAEAYQGSRVELHNATVQTMAPANALFTSNAFGTTPSTFLVDGGSVTANVGAAIGVEGVGATFILQNGAVVSGISSAGVSGAVPRVMNVESGGDATLQASSATLNGGIFVDSTSSANATLTNKTVMTGDSLAMSGGTLNINLLSGSTWTGAALPVTNVTVDPSSTWTVTANSTVTGAVTNAGLIEFTPPGPAGAFKTLTTMNYVGAGGTLGLNTFLGADNSPSDKLVINGGSASGTSSLRITNAGGPGAETTANGILVVQATSGGTTAPSAFTLDNPELRAGAFDYRLFRGGLNGSDPNNWFLRSTFIESGPVEPIGPSPPPGVLPPGFWPIIGPELATDGVVQPIARQMGLQTLGTLHQRIGDTLTLANTGGDGAGVARSDWARFFGQGIDNRYDAFADPRAGGWMGGFQGGVDLLRSSFLPGHRDVAGVYIAFANSDIDVHGLVTNPAATAYVQVESRCGAVAVG
jgi:hypothetical protein